MMTGKPFSTQEESIMKTADLSIFAELMIYEDSISWLHVKRGRELGSREVCMYTCDDIIHNFLVLFDLKLMRRRNLREVAFLLE